MSQGIANTLKILFKQFKNVLEGNGISPENANEVAETLMCDVLVVLFPPWMTKTWDWLWDEEVPGLLYVVDQNEIYAVNLYSDLELPRKVDEETEKIVRTQLENYIPQTEK